VNHHGMHDLPLKLAPMGETCFGTTGFRFVRIDNTDPRISIHLLECSARIPQYDIPPAGSFECSDPLLNDIFRAFRRTVDNCMCPLITDGAKRDKLVWMGDLFPEIRAVCAIYGNHPAVPATLDFLLNESAGTAIFNNMEVYTPYIFLCTSEYLRRCRAD